MIAPFLMGLAGSLHCVGMCGPLAMTLSGGKNIGYNIGRITTYGISGAIISVVGMGLSLAGLQQGISIAVGIAILLVAIGKIRMIAPPFVVKFIMLVRSRFRLHPFLAGMVNGLLPCGMTLVALSYCITLDGPLEGFVAMMIFGIGTLPAMLSLSLMTKSFIHKLPNIQTALMIVAGVLSIGRGIAVPHESHSDDVVVCGPDSKK